MKYAIMADYNMWDDEKKEEYSKWMYLGVEDKLRLFIFDEEINENTKLFDTATEAGKYIDKHFSEDNRICYKNVRMVEVM